MDQEIEIKLSYGNKTSVISQLERQGFRYHQTDFFDDTYYSDSSGSMDDKKSNLIRIRKTKKYSELTFKSKRKTKLARQEINIKIDSKMQMHKILLLLGLRVISRKVSKREIWVKKDATALFIEIKKPKRLIFMELEAKSEPTLKRYVKNLGDVIKPLSKDAFKKFD